MRGRAFSARAALQPHAGHDIRASHSSFGGTTDLVMLLLPLAQEQVLRHVSASARGARRAAHGGGRRRLSTAWQSSWSSRGRGQRCLARLAIRAMAPDVATVCGGELRRLREAAAAEGAGAVAGVTEIVNALDKGAGDGRTALRGILISSL